MKGLRESIASKKITVLGAGTSGMAAVELLLSQGVSSLLISDVAKISEWKKWYFKNHGVEFEEMGHTNRVFGSELVILSPGINVHTPFIERIKQVGIPLMGELELGYRFVDGEIIAVTGTNGKSTVVTMLSKMIENSVMAGNIGAPLSKFHGRKGTFVTEVSSFQLMSILDFRPKIAIILNIDQDHLDWHRDFDEYIHAKARIFENQREDDFLILNFDDPITKNFARGTRSQVLFFSINKETDAFLKDEKIFLNMHGEEIELIKLSELKLKGKHNVYNALAASLAAIVAGAKIGKIREVLKNMTGLPHRVEFVREINGIRFYDDSKATNPHAVKWALQSFSGNVILILGGEEKFLDYTSLIPLVREKVKFLILFGKNTPALERTFDGVIDFEKADSLSEVVDLALKRGKAGDIVLFSPGTSSFDMFKNYKERGERFKDEVTRVEI